MSTKEMIGERPHKGSGSYSGIYYLIEVRTIPGFPIVLPGEHERQPFVIDQNWRIWPIRMGAVKYGVNIPVEPYQTEALERGLLPYEAAEAHRWALVSALRADPILPSVGVETRLVSVEFKVSYEYVETGVSEPMAVPHRAWDSFQPRQAQPNKEAEQ